MKFAFSGGRLGVSFQRVTFGVALIGMLLSTIQLPAYAALTGTISGIVTDAKTSAPVANVKVTAISPTDRAAATTDDKGFFSLTGLQPDTYTVSFELKGFEADAVSGVTVSAEQIVQLNHTESKSLREIGRVAAHSAGSAFQANQTTDTYTITNSQVITTQGKDNANDEITLIGSLPGAETDSSGYPSLRGGRENEIGFQYEGMNYDEPYSNQFANSLLLNGVGSLQVSPGAGDASQGNSGTGVINLIAKRGTYPGFGMVSGEAASQTFYHDFIFEYGIASQDGRLSNYFKYIGQRQGELYGDHNSNLDQIGQYDGNSFNIVNDFVDNLVYKFGKDQTKSIQAFYEGQVVQYLVGAGEQQGATGFRSCTAMGPGTCGANSPELATQYIASIYNLLGGGFTANQIGGLQSLYPGQPNQNAILDGRPSYNQPLQALKLQYNDNVNSSTYYNLRFYRLSAVTTFDFPFTIPAPAGSNDYQIQQGGLRTGGAFDLNSQLNSKNLISLGAHDDYDLPVYSFFDPRSGLFNTSGLGEAGGFLSAGQGFELADFLPAAGCPAGVTGLGGSCGYLATKLGTVPRIPADDAYEPYQRHEYGAYIKDDIQMNDKLRLSAGLRLDGSSYNFGDLEQQFGIPNGTSAEIHPLILQPRLSGSFRLTPRDSISASFGRSMQNPYFSSEVNAENPAAFKAFDNIPAYDNLTGNTGSAVTFCGIHANQACKSYGDQLFWEYQNSLGLPVFTVQPEQFLNWDDSYAHQFPAGYAVKVTPFYRKGENIIVSSNPIIAETNGTPVLGPTTTSNLGVEKTSGIEFLLTKDAAYGFSGQLSATYINEFSNIPPLASQEDVFPSISPASLALGKLYRVGFLSPFVAQLSAQYKTHSGFRINPVIQYTRGYPYNQGYQTAYFVPGAGAQTVPNTNLTSPNGSNLAPCYVDPGSPGSLQAPNIVACRGTAETANPGGILSNARFDTDLTLEYEPPHSRVLIGVQVLGLFNNVFGYPTENDCYQPVATGVSGPASGSGVCSYSQKVYGNGYNGNTNIRGNSPYLLIPDNNYSFTAQTTQTPLLTLFYVQVKL
jgi:hypothetical protein